MDQQARRGDRLRRGIIIRHHIYFQRTRQTIIQLPGLSEAQQINVIKKTETSDLPPNDLHILEGVRSLYSEILTLDPD
jgi:hypothetical protein